MDILSFVLVLALLAGYILFCAFCSYHVQTDARSKTLELGQALPVTSTTINRKKKNENRERASAHLGKAFKFYDQAVAHLEANKFNEARNLAMQGLLHLQLAEAAVGEPRPTD